MPSNLKYSHRQVVKVVDLVHVVLINIIVQGTVVGILDHLPRKEAHAIRHQDDITIDVQTKKKIIPVVIVEINFIVDIRQMKMTTTTVLLTSSL